MKKEFNTTGNCFEKEHYMMDDSRRFNSIFELVERGKYFVINRPRQYGKTTMLFALLKYLHKSEEYLPVKMDFQSLSSEAHESEAFFSRQFWKDLIAVVEWVDEPLADTLRGFEAVNSFSDLSNRISAIHKVTPKKVVLLIDEVDSSSNYDVFLRFLAMLRDKYLKREFVRTFHSIVLAGVHDIKSLKFKLRNHEDTQTNSPWNVAVDFEVVMEFYPNEIAYMLRQYSEAEGVAMDFEAISERLYYHTSGYPFLVSKLCKNIVEDVLPTKENKTEWTLEDVEESVKLFLKEKNTNFDSVIKNLENHADLYSLANRIIINGEIIPFNQYNPTIEKGILYGIFKRNGQIRIHNRIYEQLIYDYMISKRITSEENVNYGGRFINDDGSLDIESVLRKFQAFMKEQRSKKDVQFIEREWRLIFLAFLKPILNGKGHDFKEVETSEEKRLDVVVTYLQYKYILELKLWRGPKAHGKGLKQLVDYLDIHGVDKGYLLIFDTRKKLMWEAKTIQQEGKEIFAVWL
jgi:inhibitor of KinA sporulation pathway (predicted exonuclease)